MTMTDDFDRALAEAGDDPAARYEAMLGVLRDLPAPDEEDEQTCADWEHFLVTAEKLKDEVLASGRVPTELFSEAMKIIGAHGTSLEDLETWALVTDDTLWTNEQVSQLAKRLGGIGAEKVFFEAERIANRHLVAMGTYENLSDGEGLLRALSEDERRTLQVAFRALYLLDTITEFFVKNAGFLTGLAVQVLDRVGLDGDPDALAYQLHNLTVSDS